ncbi:MAG: alpha/beta hydrolase [Candidatus Omnitrophota bacterium]|jgi:hypothetical protein
MTLDSKTVKHLLIGEFTLKRFLISILEIYLLLLVYAFFFSGNLTFYPHPSSYKDGPGIIKLKVTDSVRISAAYLPAKDAKFVILYSHGNAEDVGDLMPLMELFRDHGFSTLSYDYEGYGTSMGRPSEKAVYRDIEAAYRYLVNDLKIDPSRIIIQGRSIGSGAAVELASKEKAAGLIIESGCVSAFRVRTVIPLAPFDRFNNITKIGNIHYPVLVMHGRKDTIMPFWHGRALFKKANQPKMCLWVDGAGHNDFFWVAGDNYWKAVKEFTALIK